MCLLLGRSSTFFALLLDRGCDPNVRDRYHQYCPHFRLGPPFCFYSREEPDYVKISGIRADAEGETPLVFAVDCDYLEIVCLLLCYGADVMAVNSHGQTPLMAAFHQGATAIAQVLVNFYDNYSHQDCFGSTALRYARLSMDPLAFDLIKAGADVNTEFDNLDSLFVLSLRYRNADLFKLMWSKANFAKIMHMEPLLLLKFVDQAKFEEAEWLEVVILILESPVGSDLLGRAAAENFFKHLLHCFLRLGISSSTRMAAIYLFLGIGFEVTLTDLKIVLRQYGFGLEVEAFIYNLDYTLGQFSSSLIINHLLGLKSTLDDASANWSEMERRHSLDCWLSYYTPSCHEKEKVKLLIGKESLECLQAVEEMSNVPLLVELSRDAVCHNIRHKIVSRKPYQFYDVIKRLSVPFYIKDVLSFKQPITSMRNNARRIISLM